MLIKIRSNVSAKAKVVWTRRENFSSAVGRTNVVGWNKPARRFRNTIQHSGMVTVMKTNNRHSQRATYGAMCTRV